MPLFFEGNGMVYRHVGVYAYFFRYVDSNRKVYHYNN